jgi:hypothetical protein
MPRIERPVDWVDVASMVATEFGIGVVVPKDDCPTPETAPET